MKNFRSSVKYGVAVSVLVLMGTGCETAGTITLDVPGYDIVVTPEQTTDGQTQLDVSVNPVEGSVPTDDGQSATDPQEGTDVGTAPSEPEQPSEPAPVVGSATLSWVAPVARTDGSPLALSQLNGYRVYSGESANELEKLAEITDYTTTSYMVSGLTVGTHYFAVTAVDVNGIESDYSEIGHKVIQ